MLMAILEDTAFPKRNNLPYNRRWTVRALAYTEDGKMAFLRIVGSDDFGRRNHLETIGGGVENDESLEEALHREVMEETGFECEIVDEIGFIVDHYNLINRETISNYFVVKLKDETGNIKRSASENDLMKGVEFLSEEEALLKLRQFSRGTVNELVQRRDYYALKHYMKFREKCDTAEVIEE